MKYVVKNYFGGYTEVSPDAYSAYSAYISAAEVFLDFAKNKHDPSDAYSALVYQDLMSTMDRAAIRKKPHDAELLAAKWAYSLN